MIRRALALDAREQRRVERIALRAETALPSAGVLAFLASRPFHGAIDFSAPATLTTPG